MKDYTSTYRSVKLVRNRDIVLDLRDVYLNHVSLQPVDEFLSGPWRVKS